MFGAKARPFLDNETTPWSRAEAKFGALCAHYDLSCLSYYHALSRGFHAHETGFGYDEIARDCLHPLSGTRGTDVMADLLLFWQRAALRRVRAARGARAAPPPVLQLPPPLQDERKVGKMQSLARNARCYSFLESGTATRFRLVYLLTGNNPPGERRSGHHLMFSGVVWEHGQALHSFSSSCAPESMRLSPPRFKSPPARVRLRLTTRHTTTTRRTQSPHHTPQTRPRIIILRKLDTRRSHCA
jgi:hypothetical protein